MHHFHEKMRIRPYFAVQSNFTKEFQADVEVEDGAHTNWTEKSNIKCLSLVFHLMDVLVHTEDDRRSTKQQDKDAEEQKAVEGNYGAVEKLIPRCYGTEPFSWY